MRQALGPLSLAALFAGCSALPAHNNTLIFGTATDVGLGVTTPSATDTSVSVNLGYKERRAAWVPLWANKGKDAMTCAEAVGAPPSASNIDKLVCKYGPKFVGDSPVSVGARSREMDDAYSTFASFGGDFNAGGSGGGAQAANANASGRLASFFATGVAAQLLATQPASVGLPKVEKKEDAEKAPALTFMTVEEIMTASREAEPVGDKPKVRNSCVAKLAAEAKLEAEPAKVLTELTATAVPVWMVLLRNNAKLNASQKAMEAAAKDLLAKLKASQEEKGRKEAAAAVCA
ncbi:MAG: hypothetical protein RJA10_82 [Pseudomonadota bacterium]|jgi:hypothetical protein